MSATNGSNIPNPAAAAVNELTNPNKPPPATPALTPATPNNPVNAAIIGMIVGEKAAMAPRPILLNTVWKSRTESANMSICFRNFFTFVTTRDVLMVLGNCLAIILASAILRRYSPILAPTLAFNLSVSSSPRFRFKFGFPRFERFF